MIMTEAPESEINSLKHSFEPKTLYANIRKFLKVSHFVVEKM